MNKSSLSQTFNTSKFSSFFEQEDESSEEEEDPGVSYKSPEEKERAEKERAATNKVQKKEKERL